MIAVTKVFEEDWQGTSSTDSEWICSNVEEVLQAVRRLNGRNKTLIELIVDEATYLTVGGGNEGRYVCYITSGEQMHNLVNPDALPGEQTVIVAGGQRGEYDAKLCCGIEEVMRAVQYFAAHGAPNPDQNWESA